MTTMRSAKSMMEVETPRNQSSLLSLTLIFPSFKAHLVAELNTGSISIGFNHFASEDARPNRLTTRLKTPPQQRQDEAPNLHSSSSLCHTLGIRAQFDIGGHQQRLPTAIIAAARVIESREKPRAEFSFPLCSSTTRSLSSIFLTILKTPENISFKLRHSSHTDVCEPTGYLRVHCRNQIVTLASWISPTQL